MSLTRSYWNHYKKASFKPSNPGVGYTEKLETLDRLIEYGLRSRGIIKRCESKRTLDISGLTMDAMDVIKRQNPYKPFTANKLNGNTPVCQTPAYIRFKQA